MKYSIHKILLRFSQCVIYRLACLFPLKNRIVATAVVGRRYADNPKFIFEEIIRQNLNIELVWVRDPKWEMNVPKGIKIVSSVIETMYAYATAKVIVSTTNYPFAYRKRKGQCVINTWHGGLGIKKLGYSGKRDKRMCDVTDVFISNSNFATRVFRDSLRYKGPIWKCGYPKNDVLVGDKTEVKRRVKTELGISEDTRVMLYAPTYRDYPTDGSPYNINFLLLLSTLEERENKEWCILIKFHPNMQKNGIANVIVDKHVKDVTSYHDMQELIMACDAMISDYSSGIFDAALAGLECYIYANDFDKYKQDRGTYLELHELPFPIATNNAELMNNITNYSVIDYSNKWEVVAHQQGLVETGHAAKDIVEKIVAFLRCGKVIWENTSI